MARKMLDTPLLPPVAAQLSSQYSFCVNLYFTLPDTKDPVYQSAN